MQNCHCELLGDGEGAVKLGTGLVRATRVRWIHKEKKGESPGCLLFAAMKEASGPLGDGISGQLAST